MDGLSESVTADTNSTDYHEYYFIQIKTGSHEIQAFNCTSYTTTNKDLDRISLVKKLREFKNLI